VLSEVGRAGTGSSLNRWFFSFIAAEFLLISIVGFAPNSIAIITGAKTNPAPIIHVHAALMFGWMIGFLAQAYFISVGNVRQHIRAGRFLFAVGLTMLLTFIYFSFFWEGEGFGRIQIPMTIERLGLFGLFLGLAFYNRTRSGESHKRFILLATLFGGGLVAAYWLGMIVWQVFLA